MNTWLLLMLSMVAVTGEATAQDAECVRERAAMIETIRAYAQADAGVLGQQGPPARAEAAAKTLRELAYDNVSVRLGDGYDGWAECGPFDAIVVTAALGELPPPLIEQLKVGGRLVMPVGAAYSTQQLTVVEKTAP